MLLIDYERTIQSNDVLVCVTIGSYTLVKGPQTLLMYYSELAIIVLGDLTGSYICIELCMPSSVSFKVVNSLIVTYTHI